MAFLDIHLFDACPGGALAAPFDERQDIVRRSTDQDGNAAIREVLHPSRKAQFDSLVAGGGAIPNTLHPPTNNETAADGVRVCLHADYFLIVRMRSF